MLSVSGGLGTDLLDEIGAGTASIADDGANSTPAPPPSLRPDGLVALAITVITVLAYLPTLLGTYGISDDYFDLVLSTRDNHSLPNVAIAGGRPISGLVQEFALSLATDVSSLRWLRLIGVLGVAATAVVGATIARTFGARRLSQVLVGLGIAAMPSSQVIASWAVLFPVSWGAALALAAGFSLTSLRTDTFRQREWWVAAGAVAAATAVGLANYQPSAMAFAPGFALALIDSSETLRRRARRAMAGVFGAAAGGVAYLVISNLLVRWRGVTADVRSSLELPGSDKLHWFVTKVAPRSLDPLSFQPRTVVAICVLLLIIAGLASLATTAIERVAVVALVIISLVVSYLPTLMVQDRWPSARSRLSIDITVGLFAGVAALTVVARASRNRTAQSAILVAWGSVITAFVIFASWRVTIYYVEPQHTEYVTVSRAIRRLELQTNTAIVIVAADWRLPLARTSDLDEFGFPSMATAWGPVALVQLEVMRAGGSPTMNIHVVSDISEVTDGTATILDIDALYDDLR